MFFFLHGVVNMGLILCVLFYGLVSVVCMDYFFSWAIFMDDFYRLFYEFYFMSCFYGFDFMRFILWASLYGLVFFMGDFYG